MRFSIQMVAKVPSGLLTLLHEDLIVMQNFGYPTLLLVLGYI